MALERHLDQLVTCHRRIAVVRVEFRTRELHRVLRLHHSPQAIRAEDEELVFVIQRLRDHVWLRGEAGGLTPL